MGAEYIRPITNQELWLALQEYNESVGLSYLARVGRFAFAHSGLTGSNVETIVFGISLTGDNNSFGIAFGPTVTPIEKMTALNIDIHPDNPAFIVVPGFYDADGNPVSGPTITLDQFMRKPLRPLSDEEGRAATDDIRQIIAEDPSRSRNKS